MTKRPAIDPRGEFAQAELGDRRLNARLDQIVAALEAAPERSFPSATASDAELEGVYRFFQNERVTLDRLLAPHLAATVHRAALVRRVVVVHDTTEFRYEGVKRREGLGLLARDGQGFFGHFALALDAADRAPLGLAGVLAFVREPMRRVRKGTRSAKRPQRESVRWGELITDVQQRMAHVVPIHVMDREADDFALFSELAAAGVRFVVRMSAARKRTAVTPAYAQPTAVGAVLRTAPIVATREVRLSPRAGHRGGQSERVHPVRAGRVATLTIAAQHVELQPPKWRKRASSLALNVVRVVEQGPPAGEAPVEWLLVTTEPVDTPEHILEIVDAYRARWTIEEYFKALKLGCAIERRQLESLHALLAALGVFAPLAVRLLALRSYARTAPTAPALCVVTADELTALRAIGRTPLSATPTVADVLLAIAALGGHLKRNGDPGWQVLARGLEKLSLAAEVVAAISDGNPAM